MEHISYYESLEKDLEIEFLKAVAEAERARADSAMAPAGDDDEIFFEYWKSLAIAHRIRGDAYKDLYEKAIGAAIECGGA